MSSERSTRGLACKNTNCEFVFMESRRRREKNVEAVKINTGQSTQLFSVRLRDRGADTRGFVQLPQVQDAHGNPAENIDPAVLLPVLQGTAKCFVENCSRAVNVQQQQGAAANGTAPGQMKMGPPCQHIKAAIECKEEARALRLKNSVLNALHEDQETRNTIWDLATDTAGPLVQRVTQNVMVVKCMISPKHPLGFLHFTFNPPAKPKATCDYATKFHCSNKDCRNPSNGNMARPPRWCIHFYACVCSFASDDGLLDEFAPFISLVTFGDASYETLRIENGMVTQNNAFMDSLQLAEEDLGAQGEEGTEESLVVEPLDQQQPFHIVTHAEDTATGHDVITTVAGDISQISPTSTIVPTMQTSEFIIENHPEIQVTTNELESSNELESTITDSIASTSDAITSANMIVADDVINTSSVMTSGDVITANEVMATSDVITTSGSISPKNVVITVLEGGKTRHEMLHVDPTDTGSSGDEISQLTEEQITKRLMESDNVIIESDDIATDEGVDETPIATEQNESVEIVVDGVDGGPIMTSENQRIMTSDNQSIMTSENQSIMTSQNSQILSSDSSQYLAATSQPQQHIVSDQQHILNASTENTELITVDDDQSIILNTVDTVPDTELDAGDMIENEQTVVENEGPSIKRIKLSFTPRATEKVDGGVTVSNQEVLLGEPKVFTMASEMLKKQQQPIVAANQNRFQYVLKNNAPKKSPSDESVVQQSFLQWLSSVTERINQTMHYQFSGTPDPLVFHAPQVFFDCLQARISAGSKKKRLPNHTSGFVRRDALPLGTFTKYTWYITNILHVKQIFDTSEVSVDITRSFIENRDGTFDYNEKSAHEKGYTNDGKNLPIRPFELKTYLKVGMTSPNQKEATPFVIEWIPDILPKSHIGELRIKFEYGHQRNGHLEDRSGINYLGNITST